MRWIKRILLTLVLLVVLLAGIGMLLPRNIEVARSIDINASPAEIFPHVNNLAATIPWSPWLVHDPDTKNTFNDIPEGVGAKMTWASEHPQVGSGTMEVITSTPNEHLQVALDFGDMGTASATWDFKPNGDMTTATWGMQTDMGAGPVGRWMGLMMDRWIGNDYEQGLKNLKELVEK